MCRLYGLRASHPTRASCELLGAQNALIHQATRDARGLSNPHGWGIATIRGGLVEHTRQVEPADADAGYREHALRVHGETVLAHVRRATVGQPDLVNTHPFRRGDAFFAHNGHIGRFDEIRPRLLEALSPAERTAIEGATDSEHFFQLVLHHLQESGSPVEALRAAARQLHGWMDSLPEPEPIFLNTLLVHEGELYGTRLDRTLWYVERRDAVRCDCCGELHAFPEGGRPYRAVAVASERITDEPWQRVPEASVFHVTAEMRLEAGPLFDEPRTRLHPLPASQPLAVSNVADEIERLHEVFEGWLNGSIQGEDAWAQRVEAAITADFQLIEPSGQVEARQPLLERIRAAHAQHATEGLRLWVEHIEVRHLGGHEALATYKEWKQQGDERPRGRLATALLRRSPRAPRGLAWLHVHETWLPEP